jgi:hypothetical protein
LDDLAPGTELTGPGGATARALAFALCVLTPALALLSGCTRIPRDPMALEYRDRCYIEDSQFVLADQLYSQLGSMKLLERHLREKEQWRNCEVNEALYRLRKVHRLP